jgi:drug/metabolite transporter (DMT)-like permease
MAATPGRRRDALLPWWIGFAIILASVAYVVYLFATLETDSAPVLAFIVCAVIPIVYLFLMYVTFQSEADTEDELRRPNRDYDPRSGMGS